MDNQQLYNLNEKQLQVILSSTLGDGNLYRKKETHNYLMSTNCIHKEYLEFKKLLLEDLSFNIGFISKNGYKQKPIYTLSTKRNKSITKIANLDLKSKLNLLSTLGLALWFYDDGSLHKTKLFYNLNTHKFSKKENEIIANFLLKYNIKAKVTKETKKDGRVFYYLRIGKYDGAYEINKILSTYPLNCFKYKLWSSETILKWSKLQEKLKSTDKVYSNMQLGKLFAKITL